jgi:hypothetical protein
MESLMLQCHNLPALTQFLTPARPHTMIPEESAKCTRKDMVRKIMELFPRNLAVV